MTLWQATAYRQILENSVLLQIMLYLKQTK